MNITAQLYGTLLRNSYDRELDGLPNKDCDDLLATFSSKEKAETYLKKHGGGWTENYSGYVKPTGLCEGYEEFEIRCIPHDPE